MILPSIKHTIGIWGFGRVGKSVARYFISNGYTIAIMDSNRNIASDNFLQEHAIPFYQQDDLDAFFQHCDFILPSPGIDLALYKEHSHQWITELDLFYALWKKPIVAITGSVGKTTTASMLAQLCTHNGITVALGGNIGIPVLDLLDQQTMVDWAIIEVSSFQLEQCQFFTPTVAIITNLHPNHLDRHGSLHAYWQAKASIFKYQQNAHHVIAPLELRNAVHAYQIPSKKWYITDTKPLQSLLDAININEAIVQLQPGTIDHYIKMNYQTYIKPNALFSRTFWQNALSIHTAFAIMQKSTLKVTDNEQIQNMFDVDYVSQPHRLEHVGTYNSVTFINDSKSTTIASTLAAVEMYKHQTIVLLLGGLSKGANREELIQQLPTSIRYIACFGAEAHQLTEWCTQYSFKSNAFDDLPSALQASLAYRVDNSVILLSPAGSSYDLYKNYEERGNHFKKLIMYTKGL